jgi:hypothetical protein
MIIAMMILKTPSASATASKITGLKIFHFNIKQYSVEIFLKDDIIFRAMDWQGDYITEFDCFIAVNSKHDSPFFIDRIVKFQRASTIDVQ